MFLLVNLFATFGALVLTIMGVAISLTYPIGGQRGHFIWMVAFVLVGIPATAAAYFVLHNYGQASGAPAAASPRVARLEPNAFAERRAPETREPSVFGERRAPETRVERVRVMYGQHRNGSHQGHPQVVTYEIRQTVQTAQASPPMVPSAMFAPPTTSSVIPANTFSCTGFTKNPDGSWEAGDDTRPFDVGKAENIVIRNQGPIEPGWVTVGGVDLYALINKKCSAAH
jgi:hypothetical protein